MKLLIGKILFILIGTVIGGTVLYLLLDHMDVNRESRIWTIIAWIVMIGLFGSIALIGLIFCLALGGC